MAKITGIVLMLFTLIVCAAQEGRAQATEFTFQGNLKDGGLAVNGNYDFEFALFDALSAGTQLGSTQAQNAVAVVNGAFSVKLDFGSQFPGASRFLEIHVRPTGGGAFTPLIPRQQINSTPYAVKALNAENATTANNALSLGGISANQYVVTTDPRMTDARDPLPNSSNYVQNNPAAQQSGSFNVSGNGIVGGNLGVGTSASDAKLGVFIPMQSPVNSGDNTAYFWAPNIGSNISHIHYGTTGDWYIRSAASAGKVVLQDSGGNVGIGTSAPSARLAVRGDGTDVLLGSAGCGAPTAAIGFGTMSGCTNFALGGNISAGADAGTFLNRPTGRSLHFRENNGPDQMTIAPGGSVGIGTTMPGAKLDVIANEPFGIFGRNSASSSIGVFGQSTGQDGTGVLGRYDGPASNNAGWGVYGFSPNGFAGVFGSGNKTGVFGQTSSNNDSGVYGRNDQAGTGVYGFSGSAVGVYGYGLNGVKGEANALANGAGVLGISAHPAGFGGLFINTSGGTALEVAGNAVVTGSISTNGTMSIGNVPGGAFDIPLCINGFIVSICPVSSDRYTSKILPLKAGLDLVRRLRPVTFDWKATGERSLGLIAEEVERVEPLLVTRNPKGEIEGVKYPQLSVVFINAFKEQQAQIEELQKQNSEQKEIISRQQALLDGLKQLVCSQNAKADVCKPSN